MGSSSKRQNTKNRNKKMTKEKEITLTCPKCGKSLYLCQIRKPFSKNIIELIWVCSNINCDYETYDKQKTGGGEK